MREVESSDPAPDAASEAPVGLARRHLLAAGGALGLGVSAFALPASSAAASPPPLGSDADPDDDEEAIRARGANGPIFQAITRTNSPEHVVIVGAFTAYDDIVLGSGNSFKPQILALSADGAIDATRSAAFAQPPVSVPLRGVVEHTRTIGGVTDRGLLIRHADPVIGTLEFGPTTQTEFSGRFLFRLKADGSLDTEFNANIPLMGRSKKSGIGDPSVGLAQSLSQVAPRVMLVHSDGAILLAGDFNEVAGSAAQATLADASGSRLSRFGALRLNADGSLDTGWSPGIGDPDLDAAPIAASDDFSASIGSPDMIIVDDQVVLAFRQRKLKTTSTVKYLAPEGQSGAREVHLLSVTDGATVGAFPAFDAGVTPFAVTATSDDTIIVTRQFSTALEVLLYPRSDGAYTLAATQPTPQANPGGATFAPAVPLTLGGDRFVVSRTGGTPQEPVVDVTLLTYAPADGGLEAGPWASVVPITGSGVAGVATLNTGRIVACGIFSSIQGEPRNNIAFIEADGTLVALPAIPPL